MTLPTLVAIVAVGGGFFMAALYRRPKNKKTKKSYLGKMIAACIAILLGGFYIGATSDFGNWLERFASTRLNEPVDLQTPLDQITPA